MLQDEAGSGDGEEDEEDEEEGEVVWMTDTSEAAMVRRAAEQLSGATAAMVTQVGRRIKAPKGSWGTGQAGLYARWRQHFVALLMIPLHQSLRREISRRSWRLRGKRRRLPRWRRRRRPQLQSLPRSRLRLRLPERCREAGRTGRTFAVCARHAAWFPAWSLVGCLSLAPSPMPLQAEEDARLAEEAAAKLALASPEVAAMSTLRQLLASGTGPAELAASLRGLELPGGPAARASVLYHVLFGDVEAGAKLAAEVEARQAYLAPLSTVSGSHGDELV